MKRTYISILILILSQAASLAMAAELVIGGSGTLNGNLYNTNGTLETQGETVIPAENQVLFVASQRIRLKPGFKAQTGSSFRAMIGNYGALQLSSDKDQDLLPDWWELTLFGDTTALERDNDYDQDGITNYIEMALGTNPLDTNNRPENGIAFAYDTTNRITNAFFLYDSESYEIEYDYDVQGNRTRKGTHAVQQ